MDEKKFHKTASSKKRFNLYNAFIGLIILLAVILLINIFLTINLSNDLKKSAEAAKESARPAKVELAVIKNSKCSDCFDISAVLNYIKAAKLNVTKENAYEFDSTNGKQLAGKYGIEKAPSVIITGEIGKLQMQGSVKNKDALIFAPEPPYTSISTGKTEGMVVLYYLDPQCGKCRDISLLIEQIKGAGIRISAQKNVTPESDEGKNLIKKYNIDFAPTIIMSRDASAYSIMQKAWPPIGSKEPDGYYVFRLAAPPFINLTTGKIRGLVGITYLTDKSCTECYDAKLHKEILTNPQTFGMKLDKEDEFDIADAKGKEMIAKYNITKVPATILSDEVKAYPSSRALSQFFSLEKNGYYVFRKLEVLGTYKDLSTNQVVKAPQRAQVQ